MKRRLFAGLLCIACAVPSYANVLADLKDKPLTSYQDGRNQLATLITAFNLGAKTRSNLHYRLELLEESQRLGIGIINTDSAKNVTNMQCQLGFVKLAALGITAELPTLIWPDLTQEQAQDVRDELFIRYQIQANDGSGKSVECTKTLAEI